MEESFCDHFHEIKAKWALLTKRKKYFETKNGFNTIMSLLLKFMTVREQRECRIIVIFIVFNHQMYSLIR